MIGDHLERMAGEIERLLKVIKTYAESSAAACREIAGLRASRDEWMARSHAHAMEADRLRVDVVNAKGRIYELESQLREATDGEKV
jgi:hypothetical protein